MVKKRMSCLMGCQECNSIIMKSDSESWLDGWMATEGSRKAVGLLHMPEHPQPPGPVETGEHKALSLIQPWFERTSWVGARILEIKFKFRQCDPKKCLTDTKKITLYLLISPGFRDIFYKCYVSNHSPHSQEYSSCNSLLLLLFFVSRIMWFNNPGRFTTQNSL